ncbi:MAG: type I-G CRISPR-associated protein Cas8g1/Csx17 [Nitriliruptorales bacterium]
MGRGMTLPVVRCPGLRADSLGHYLAALGVLRVSARRWPRVRAAWPDGGFCLVGGPDQLDDLVEQVIEIGRRSKWTPYARSWKEARAAEKKRRSGEPSPLAVWRSEAPEVEAELSLAHSVTTDRLFDNPLLGQGGGASRRDFSKGRMKAAAKISGEKPGKARDAVEADLERFLVGEPCSVLGPWNAASWFSQANKLYNFSATKPSAEGQVTPWAMVLACESLVFFAGSTSRRLGARGRGRGAFPFVTAASAPGAPGRLTHDKGEVWVPVWSRPMTLAEVRWLFLRGRAELGGRGAVTPAAFAAATLRRGVDAGVDGFIRFVLGQTTNPDMFESQRAQRVPVQAGPPASDLGRAHAQVAERVVALVDTLPRDRPRKQNGRFVGLRGPVEAALVEFAARSDHPESARWLLDTVADALDRVDRNRAHRERGVCGELLPAQWLAAPFGGDRPPLEARLAMGFASVGATDLAAPFVVHRIGVEVDQRYFQFPAARPARTVWSSTALEADLALVVHRRLVEAERGSKGSPVPELPFGATVSLHETDIAAWLDGRVDDRLVAAWLRRLVLFDWSNVPSDVRSLCTADGEAERTGMLHLYGLLRPLFDPRPLTISTGEELLARDSGARSVGAARRIAMLLSAGQIDQALDLAFSRYRMARRPAARFETIWGPLDRRRCQRLVAALLLQACPRRLVALAERWARPSRNEEGA